jgi:uncharacterized membrane protein
MKTFAILIALALVTGMVSAQTTPVGSLLLTGVQSGMTALCASLKSLLPVAAMLMIIIAGVIYAAGQIMGAETRARANVWATAALTGALIAILIVVVAPPVLNAIYAGQGTINGTICA